MAGNRAPLAGIDVLRKVRALCMLWDVCAACTACSARAAHAACPREALARGPCSAPGPIFRCSGDIADHTSLPTSARFCVGLCHRPTTHTPAASLPELPPELPHTQICNHPDLLERAQQAGAPDYGAPERSGKLQVLLRVLEHWHSEGHRCGRGAMGRAGLPAGQHGQLGEAACLPGLQQAALPPGTRPSCPALPPVRILHLPAGGWCSLRRSRCWTLWRRRYGPAGGGTIAWTGPPGSRSACASSTTSTTTSRVRLGVVARLGRVPPACPPKGASVPRHLTQAPRRSRRRPRWPTLNASCALNSHLRPHIHQLSRLYASPRTLSTSAAPPLPLRCSVCVFADDACGRAGCEPDGRRPRHDCRPRLEPGHRRAGGWG